MIYLFDKDENIKNVLSIDEIENEVHERRLGEEWSFIFETKLEYLPYLIKNSKVGFYDSEKQFRLFYVDEEPEIDYLDKTIKVHTSHDSYRLTNTIVESVYLQDATPNKAMTSALVKTDYEVGVVEVTGSEMLKLVDLTVYEVLYSLSELYGGELDFRIEFDEKGQRISRKLVDFKNRLGNMTNLRFTFDLNVDNVVRTEISENHFNVLYGRGKTSTDEEGNETTLTFEDVADDDKPLGQGYVEDLESISKYGRLEGIYKNGHFELADSLLKRTREILQQVKDPVYNYEVTINDLSDNERFEHFKVVIGDDIIILDEDRGLQLNQRVVGISETLKDKIKTLYISHLPVTYTGDIDKVLSNSESRLNEIVTEINDVENGLVSKITQTAESIRLEVSDVKDGLESKIEQTADSITSEVKNVKEGLESTITQTAKDIRLEVSDVEKGLNSKITQTADSITSQVSANYTDLDGKITSANSQIQQNATNIQSKVDVNGVKSIIQQNPDSVKIGFNGISDVIDMSTTGITVNHSKGQTKMSSNGFEYLINGQSSKYKCMTYKGEFHYSFNSLLTYFTISVPDAFKGRPYDIIVSLNSMQVVPGSLVGFGAYWSNKGDTSFNIEIKRVTSETSDTANATGVVSYLLLA